MTGGMRSRRRLPWLAVTLGVAAAALLGGLVGYRLSPSAPVPVIGSAPLGPEATADGATNSGQGAVEALPAVPVLEIPAPADPETTAPEGAEAALAGGNQAGGGLLRTYPLSGGTVVVDFNGGRVSIVEIRLAEGFVAEDPVEDEDGVVEVNLRSGPRHSQLRVWLDGGPQVALDDH